MPSHAPLCAWFAACVVAVPFVALAQERSADEVVDAIVRDGPRAIAIRSDVDVVRRDQQARLAFPNPAVAYSREGAGFTEFLQVEQPLPIFGVRGVLARAGVAATAAAEAERDVRLWDLRVEATRLVTRWLWAQARVEATSVDVQAVDRLVGLLRVPEVTSTARRTGRAELDEHVQGVESAEIDVRLTPSGRPKAVVLDDIRQKVSLLPGTNVTVGQPISHRIDHMLSGTRANIAVKIFGDDLPTLRELGQQVQTEMAQVPGVVDLSAEAQADIPTLRVKVDAAAASRYGLVSGAVSEALQTARVGRQVGQILEGQIAVPLVVRYELGNDTALSDVGATCIQTPDGGQVPLSAVASLAQDRGPNFVMRENAQRRMVVQCNVAGRDLRSVVDDIRTRVSGSVALPQGYRVEYGGQFESEADASSQLLGLSLAVIVAIFFILMSAFGSARDGLLIMVNLPLALIGGVAGLYLAGGVLSVASIVGFITLFGIATRNGIMLVSHIKHLQTNEGVTDFRTAVVHGATERVVPILMTALAAGLALVPIALSAGEPGSEIQAPMAMVILFGLASSTALNMVVVPILYERFGRPSTAAGSAPLIALE